MANRFEQLRAQATHAPADPELSHEYAQSNLDSVRYIPGETSPFVEGVGGGMVRGLRGLGNILFKSQLARTGGVGPTNGTFFGDDAIRQQEEMDRPLKAQEGAGLGNFLGEMAVTPTLGGGAATRGGSMLTRTLGARAAPRAAEGAVAGGMYADPSQQSSGAGAGAVLSAALGRGGDALGRVGTGIVRKSAPAQHLEHLAAQHGTDIHIPLPQAADPKDLPSAAIGGLYRFGLPFVPFARGRLENQGKEARTAFRRMSMQEATPDGLTLTDDDIVRPIMGKKKISDEFRKAYAETVKSYAFNIPSDLDEILEQEIRNARPKIDKTTLADTLAVAKEILTRFSDGNPSIDGENLLYAKKMLSKRVGQAEEHEREGLKAVVNWIEKHIADELKQGNVPQNLADLKRYQELSEPWRNKVALDKAINSSRRGEFSPQTLGSVAREGTDLQHLAHAADEVLGGPVTVNDASGKIMLGAGLAGMGVGAFMNPAVAAGMVAGGHGLVNKGTQRFLMGDTASQKKFVEFMRNNPQLRETLGAMRRAISAETGDQYNGY